MGAIVGIDLGTTNSALAILDESGRPSIIENAAGSNITPSAIFFEQDGSGSVTVGQDAKDQESLYPERVFQAFKRSMDHDGAVASSAEGAPMQATPIELSAHVLRKLIADASARVGPIDSAVITVPANFADEARRNTIAAGELAGLTVKHIINEPTAAVFYYAFERPLAGTVVVYDLGGGTLDVSIANVDGSKVEIVTSKGDPRLGGVDFDLRLREIIAGRYQELTGETFDMPAVHDLGKSIEDYKKQFSSRDSITVQVTGGSAGKTVFEVTRSEFEAAASTLIARADLLVEGALLDVGIAPTAVSDVLLVGGSTRMPMIGAHLESLFGRAPICSVNPDEVVALGAALYAGVNAEPAAMTPAQTDATRAMQLREVANHFYGTIILETSHASGPRDRVSIVIEKNAPIPVSKTESFYTVSAGQTAVECTVTQSVTREFDPDFVRRIWSGELGPLPAGRDANQQIDVTFSYDANQVMHCAFVDVATGLSQEVSLGLGGSSNATGDDRFRIS
jgi:molecular chaperone DnaK